MDTNSFRLPTKADEKWLNSADSANLLPIQLRDEIRNNGYRRFIITHNVYTGQQSEVLSSEYGQFTVGYQPYEKDVTYKANSEATLYQAGSERLYVKATLYGEGDIPSTKWFCSENGGQQWQEQAYLTYDWLNKTCPSWPLLSYLSRRNS